MIKYFKNGKKFLSKNCTLGKLENNDSSFSFNLSLTPPLLASLLSSRAVELILNYHTTSFLSLGLFRITYLALPAGLLNTPGVMVTAWLALHS